MTSIISGVPGGYRLVWSDEFEKGYIDSSKWGFDIGGNGWGNNELQYYTSRWENAYVSNSQLHIRAIRGYYDGRDYTSARLLTKGRFDFQYGYVEARIALPRLKGIWPAFWMLGRNIDQVGWPNCGEIDILEAVNEENKSYATCHWFIMDMLNMDLAADILMSLNSILIVCIGIEKEFKFLLTTTEFMKYILKMELEILGLSIIDSSLS
jgi:hypothetical protein